MLSETLFLVSPLILGGGLFIKNKKLCCFYCGVIFFLFSALYSYDFFFGAYTELGSDMSEYRGMLSPALVYGGQLLSMITPDSIVASVLWGLVSASGLMLYIYKYCYYTAPSAVTAAVIGLWLVCFVNPAFFMGIIISAFGYRYASERRFTRYIAIMLFAACFDLRIIALIPFYLVFITKPTVYHIPAAVIVGGVLMLFDISPVLGIFPGFSAERTETNMFLSVVITAVSALIAITAKIIVRRGDYHGTMVAASAVAGAFALGSFFDGRLLYISSVCFFPVSLVLVPETVMIAKSIIALTFRKKKTPVFIIGGILLCFGVMAYHYFFTKNCGFEYSSWFMNPAV